MARRNKRKYRQNGIILPIPFGGIVVLLSSLAIGYVWLDCRCGAIDVEIKQLEELQAKLHQKYLNEQCRWATLKSPRGIEAALRKHGIKMALPRSDQIVVLRDTRDVESPPARRVRTRSAFARIEGVVMNE